MKSTFRILFYLKRNGQKSNGNTPIMGRITINGQAVQFSAKVEINPDYWNVEAGKAIGRTNDIKEVNFVLDNMRATMTKIYRDLCDRESSVTPERIKNIFFGIEEKHHMLLELFKRHNDDLFSLISISKTKATFQKYDVTRRRIANFIRERYNVSDIALKEINHLFLSDFEVYLLTTAKCNPNTTAKFLQTLKSIVLIAKNNGWIHSDPYLNYKIRMSKVDRGYLTQEEIEIVMQKKFSSKRLEQIRDIFLFSCFTGIVDKKQRKEKEGNRLIVRKECSLVALSAE